MKQAIIFANGTVKKIPEAISNLQSFDLIIAADGGAHHCKLLGIQPNVIIGDLDSINAEELNLYRNARVDIIQYPTNKDETDLELALKFIIDQDISEVIIIGALGARWDMTIANILLLTHPMFAGLNIRIFEGFQELALLRAGERTDIHAQPGDIISLIPLAGDVQGISTQGLKYPLNDETLRFGSSRGVSNAFVQNQANVFFTHGFLLSILTRSNN